MLSGGLFLTMYFLCIILLILQSSSYNYKMMEFWIPISEILFVRFINFAPELSNPDSPKYWDFSKNRHFIAKKPWKIGTWGLLHVNIPLKSSRFVQWINILTIPSTPKIGPKMAQKEGFMRYIWWMSTAIIKMGSVT